MINEYDLKKLLQKIEKTDNFEIYYTGKKSKRINGSYKPESKEIYINNRNFENDNELILTAIHEYAHHIQNTEFFMKSNPHDKEFWYIFHNILKVAENLGLYENCCNNKNKSDFAEMRKSNALFNEQTLEYFKSVATFYYKIGEDNTGQFSDCMVRFLKHKRGESLKMVAAAEMSEGYQYNTMLKLSNKRNIDQDLLFKLNFGNVGEKSISLDQFDHLHADKKFSDEIAYWQAKKEKIENAIESGKEKAQSLIYKIQKLINKKG